MCAPYILIHEQFSPFPSKLEYSHNNGYEHPAQQHYEHAAEVGQTQLSAASFAADLSTLLLLEI